MKRTPSESFQSRSLVILCFGCSRKSRTIPLNFFSVFIHSTPKHVIAPRTFKTMSIFCFNGYFTMTKILLIPFNTFFLHESASSLFKEDPNSTSWLTLTKLDANKKILFFCQQKLNSKLPKMHPWPAVTIFIFIHAPVVFTDSNVFKVLLALSSCV